MTRQIRSLLWLTGIFAAAGLALGLLRSKSSRLLNFGEVYRCLDEVERELFRIADTDECQRFHKDTQLTAVVLLLLRSASLLRTLPPLLQSNSLDGFDAVLRAFEETWNLAHEFRLTAQHDKATKWLARVNDTSSAHIPFLVEFAKGRGHHGPNLGHDYGILSELAHPTRTAAENSTTLCGVRLKIEGAEAEIGGALENDEKRISYALYRLLWLILDQDSKFVAVPANPKNMPESSGFVESYEHIDPGT